MALSQALRASNPSSFQPEDIERGVQDGAYGSRTEGVINRIRQSDE